MRVTPMDVHGWDGAGPPDGAPLYRRRIQRDGGILIVSGVEVPMRKRWIAFFCVPLCLFLWEYGSRNVPLSHPPEAGVSAFVSQLGLEEGCTELSADEIAWFNTAFFNAGDGINMRNMMLMSLYQEVRAIDLSQLFYNGAGNGRRVSGREKRLLAAVDENAATLDIVKVTRQDMNALLLAYAGISLADSDGVGLNQFIFLKEYDAYYLIHSDVVYGVCNITSGVRKEDGTFLLNYELNGQRRLVTLRKVDAGFQFISNEAE